MRETNPFRAGPENENQISLSQSHGCRHAEPEAGNAVEAGIKPFCQGRQPHRGTTLRQKHPEAKLPVSIG
jgi:hypothetical protein